MYHITATVQRYQSACTIQNAYLHATTVYLECTSIAVGMSIPAVVSPAYTDSSIHCTPRILQQYSNSVLNSIMMVVLEQYCDGSVAALLV